MSSSSTNNSRLLTLYDMDSGKQWSNFLLTSSMTWNDMIVSMQAALGRQGQELWPHDRNGEPFLDTDAVFNFASIANGEKLIVTIREGTRVTSYLDLEYMLYLEEEDADAFPVPLRLLDADAKRIHMEKLRRRDGIASKNICRIVLPYSEVKQLIEALNNVSKSSFKRKYSVKNTQAEIAKNWRTRTTPKTQHLTKDLKCFAMIDIFSKILPGQHLLGEDLLITAANARVRASGSSGSRGIVEQDVLDAIQNLYEAADAIDSTWDDTKENRAINKRADRMEAYNERRKGEAATARENAAAEDMGEEAAEAAHPGKGKGKAVDMLAGRLEKTMLPDVMPDEDEDEESEEGDDDDDSDYVDQ